MSSVRDLFASIEIESDFRQLLKLDTAMDQIEDSLKGMDGTLDDATKEIEQLGDSGKDAMKDIQKGSNKAEDAVDHLGDEFKRTERTGVSAADKITGALKTVGGVIAAVFAVNKVKDFFTNAIEGAAEMNAMNAQFDQVFGEEMVDQAQKSVDDISKSTGMLGERVKPAFTGMAAFAKTAGMETADSLKLAERATLAAADSAAFYDKSIEEVTETLQSYLKGNYANDAALGISSTETTRNAAANKLYSKSFNKLSESQKQLTLLAMVEDANILSGALGQAARESDAYENQIGNLRQAWKNFTALIGQPLLNPAIKGIKRLSEFIQGIDTDSIVAKFKEFGSYLSDKFGPILSKIDTGDIMGALGSVGSYLKDTFGPAVQDASDLIAFLWRKFEESGGLDVTKDMLNGVKDVLLWFRDNSSVVTAAIAGIGTTLGVFRLAAIGAAIATWSLNTAMLANPFTWIAVGIGALIGIGVLLYKNWEEIKVVAYGLWTMLRMTFQNIADWTADKIGSVLYIFKNLGEVWEGVKNSLTNFVLPKWMSKIGDTLGGLRGKVGSMFDGSHETGLNRVPHDGYVAELHKDEAVLTAREAQQWRRGEPKGGGKPDPGNFRPSPGGGGGNHMETTVHITVQGGNTNNETGKAVEQAVEKVLDKKFRQLNYGLEG